MPAEKLYCRKMLEKVSEKLFVLFYGRLMVCSKATPVSSKYIKAFQTD